MKIKTRCDNCGKVYNMASEYIGRTAQCKHCGQHFIMNSYEAAAPAAKPQAAPAAAPPAPAFQAQPAVGQHPMADQTILPNAAKARNYAPQAPYQPPQQTVLANQMRPPQAPPYAPQPNFQGQAAPQLMAGRTQTVLCLKCGYTAEIPVPGKKMKVTCQACGAKIAVAPAKQPKAAKAGGGGGSSSKSVLLLLILVLLLVGALFVGPMLLPDIFPDLIGGLLG